MTRTKTRLLSLVLAVVMAIGILATGLIRFPNGLSAVQSTFTDVPTTFWAYDYIERAAADGAVNGVRFRLDAGFLMQKHLRSFDWRCLLVHCQ